MKLEDIKNQWWGKTNGGGYFLDAEQVDWLIAEVERLQDGEEELFGETERLKARVEELDGTAYTNGELYNKEYMKREEAEHRLESADNMTAYWRQQYTALEKRAEASEKEVERLNYIINEDFLLKAIKREGYLEGVEDQTIKILEAFGHVQVTSSRCQARYKDSEYCGQGPRSLPVWCDLKTGHEGPHRHVTGHRSFIMDREHLIEMKPLPDICQKCGTSWPCQDAKKALEAIRALKTTEVKTSKEE